MRFPACPNCAQPMTFGRLIPGGAVCKPVNAFDCRPCRLGMTEAGPEEPPNGQR